MAYQLDSAVATFGNALMYELGKVEGKDAKRIEEKQDQIISRWIGREPEFSSPTNVKKRRKGEEA